MHRDGGRSTSSSQNAVRQFGAARRSEGRFSLRWAIWAASTTRAHHARCKYCTTGSMSVVMGRCVHHVACGRVAALHVRAERAASGLDLTQAILQTSLDGKFIAWLDGAQPRQGNDQKFVYLF